ncbi:hypothetical protein diail_9007, partial [Diaporthe ilicicola]
LTNHGILQARRLGAHLAARSPVVGFVQHIFVSNLQRAVRTAEAVAESQAGLDPSGEAVKVVQLPELREKNFGSDEGRRFGSRGAELSPKPAGWIEAESKESMKARVERFIDARLIPSVLRGFHSDVNHCVVIVAHGIILNVLLRCLLARFGPEELNKVTRPTDTPGKMEWLASWSNTGYLEADLRLRISASSVPAGLRPPITSVNGRPLLGSVVPRQNSKDNAVAAVETRQGEAPTLEILMTVTSVNSTEHLQGLKKTRGGIGSAAFDQKQKTMDSFFTRPAKASPPVKAPSPVKDDPPVEPSPPVDPSPPAEAAQSVKGPRPQPQPQPQPRARTQPQPRSQPQPDKAPQPVQPVQAPPPPKAAESPQPVQPTQASQAVQSPRPAKTPKLAESSRQSEVTRPIKAAESTKPVEQVKSPPPAEALQPVEPPQPTEAARPVKAPQPVKITRAPTEVSVSVESNVAEPAKVTQPTKPFRPKKVKRPVKKAKVFKKVRFALDFEEI